MKVCRVAPPSDSNEKPLSLLLLRADFFKVVNLLIPSIQKNKVHFFKIYLHFLMKQ